MEIETPKVQACAYEVKNILQRNDISENFMAEWPKNLKIDVLDKKDRMIVFEVSGISPAIANTIRRVLIAEIPTMAIETCFVNNNTSVMQDEVLCHRLGLIPIKAEPNDFEYVTEKNNFTDANSIKFSLKVKCPSKAELQTMPRSDPTNPKPVEYMTVYSHSIKATRVGKQLNNLCVADDDIIVMKLAPGQEIDIDMYAVKGVGQDHAKWSPVCTASYRMRPDIYINKPKYNQDAIDLVKCCPMGVFDIEDLGNGKIQAVVNKPMNCSLCRECIRGEGKEEDVLLYRVKNDFIYTVESTGVIPVETIMNRALEVIKSKCAVILNEINKIERGDIEQTKDEEQDEEEEMDADAQE
ncbi:hypothetical protein WA158_000158 [Blastocystis sp. Blastoise]